MDFLFLIGFQTGNVLSKSFEVSYDILVATGNTGIWTRVAGGGFTTGRGCTCRSPLMDPCDHRLLAWLGL